MFPYVIYCCCRTIPSRGLQRDRDRARLLLIVAACVLYASAIIHYF